MDLVLKRVQGWQIAALAVRTDVGLIEVVDLA
jgi:hypothetical protein